MLFDVVMACAPLVAVAPAVIAVATCHTDFASKGQLQRGLYRSLLLAEKLPATTPGSRQIAADIDKATLAVAYRAQYPQRSTETTRLALVGLGLLTALVVYYALLWVDAWWVYQVLFGIPVLLTAAWLYRAVGNFVRNDGLTRTVFGYFGAPTQLIRPSSELIARTPPLTMAAVFERAAEIRDRDHGVALSSVDAVNAAMASFHTPVDWRALVDRTRRQLHTTDYRGHAETARTQAENVAAQSFSLISSGYDRALQTLTGPVFALRLSWLDAREHDRIAKAERAGDVYRAAWLATHYRDERSRVAGQLSWLRAQRNVRPRWPLHSERDRTSFAGGDQ
ncbi:hypothetical protein [Mycolicibacterium brisbanense]|uniref:Helix-turn-helix domain protein n=1 Tax=Mycolicibacterium brisbanense TaxID=146020 RepID=A0A117I688_9MYCO|nr:hypothetical protein [Mycolicibacterium brisbanense]MCV7160130.1 hypothetical protein [Mycolicibacterium brisbanense]GAS89687.1 helix-turn-helix domain protein [Mycolicibacterium brisbanense]